MCLTMKETCYTRPIPLEVNEETISGGKIKCAISSPGSIWDRHRERLSQKRSDLAACGDGGGKNEAWPHPLPPAFTQRPDDKRQHVSKTFPQESVTQGAALILRNKVSAVCRVLGSGRSREREENQLPWSGQWRAEGSSCKLCPPIQP